MIVTDDTRNDKVDRALAEWVQVESARVATEMLQRIPPAARQAMTTLEDIETGTQALTQNIGRQITQALMGAGIPDAVGVCRECGAPLRQVALHRARSITGIFGDYEWDRPYLGCPKGHGSEAPHDRV